jgi:hypothetical protein
MSCCIIPYNYADDAVGARYITDFEEGLCVSGWDVEIITGNRYHAKTEKK